MARKVLHPLAGSAIRFQILSRVFAVLCIFCALVAFLGVVAFSSDWLVGPSMALADSLKRPLGKKFKLKVKAKVDSDFRFTFTPQVLRTPGTVRVCNRSKALIAPYSVSPFATRGDAGELENGQCGTLKFKNTTDSLQTVHINDELHSTADGFVCLIPQRKLQCIGKIIASDSGCESKEKCCDDGLDNDGDGLTDCDDLDCSNKADCEECVTREIPVSFKFQSETDIFNSTLCTTVALIRWPEQPDDEFVISAEASWTVVNRTEGSTSESPYDDVLVFDGRDFTVPGGFHQIAASISGGQSPAGQVASCSSLETNYAERFFDPTLVLTLCPE